MQADDHMPGKPKSDQIAYDDAERADDQGRRIRPEAASPLAVAAALSILSKVLGRVRP